MAEDVRCESRAGKLGQRALQAAFIIVWWVGWFTVFSSRAYDSALIGTAVGLEVCIPALYGVIVRGSTEQVRSIVVGVGKSALADAKKAIGRVEAGLGGKAADMDAAFDVFDGTREAAEGALAFAGRMRFTKRLFSAAVWLLVALLLLVFESTAAVECPVVLWPVLPCGVWVL